MSAYHPYLPDKLATLNGKHQGKLTEIERLKESLHDLKQDGACCLALILAATLGSPEARTHPAPQQRDPTLPKTRAGDVIS